jgi:hypothetical protein
LASLANSIVWANIPSQIALPYGVKVAISYSTIEDGQVGIDADSGSIVEWLQGNSIIDPLLTGGRLLPNSPCIDAGSNSLVPANLLVDLDGKPRFVDDAGTADTGSGTPPIIDMGAYEFQETSTPPDADNDGIPDTYDECPGTIPGATVDTRGCPPVVAGDLDRDGDVDTEDFAIFQRCQSGPNIPADPDCR